MWEPRRRRKKTPYYKVQVYNPTLQVWKDERGAFDTIKKAKDYIAAKVILQTARIIVVEERDRHVLAE